MRGKGYFLLLLLCGLEPVDLELLVFVADS